MGERHRENAVQLLGPLQLLVDEVAHRLAGRREGTDHSAVERGHRRPRTPLHASDYELCDLGRSLVGVGVRILLERDQHVRQCQQLVGQVAVAVEQCPNWDAVADALADACEEVGLAVGYPVGGHRPVKRQQDAVDRLRRFELVEQPVAEREIAAARGQPRGQRVRICPVNQLVAVAACDVRVGTEAGAEGDLVAHLGRVVRRRDPIVVEARRDRGEHVRLGADPGCEQATRHANPRAAIWRAGRGRRRRR